MTCIVAITDGIKVIMGSDAAGISGLDLTIRKDEKIFVKDEFIFGFTSSFRMGQVLTFKFNPPFHIKKSIEEYIATDFVDALRKEFSSSGVAKNINGEESCGNFLVGYKGRIFFVESDYQVGESVENYNSVGCGAQIAKGCLFGLKNLKIENEEKINIALSAAQEYSAGVRGPFKIKSV